MLKTNQLHTAAAKYVNEFTDTIRAIAAQLGDTKLLNKLRNNVRSSELYYHNNCHVEYKGKYNNKTFHKVENSDVTYDEFSGLTSIKNYVDDSEDDSFDLKSLEIFYIDGLAETGKSIDSHITWFAAKIVNADVGLTVVQSTSGGKYQTFNASHLVAAITDAEWCQVLRNVVEPISEENFQIHKMKKSSMSDLSQESLSSQHKKLGLLITDLYHGKPDANYLPLNLDTICQQTVFNTSKRSPSSKWNIIRHSSDKEWPAIHYATIKLFSVIRSKSLIHILFERDMVLSYDKILMFINELSETVKALYNDLGDKVLPSTLCWGIFIIFIDDNIDKKKFVCHCCWPLPWDRSYSLTVCFWRKPRYTT